MSDVLLSELTNADIDWLVHAGQQMSVQAGSLVSDRVGDRSEKNGHSKSMYLVLDGRLIIQPSVRSLSTQDDGLQLSSGDVLNSELVFGLHPTPMQVQALEDSIVLEVPVGVLRNQLGQNITFAAHVYRAIALILSEQLRRIYASPHQLHASDRLSARDALFVFGELRDSDLDWLVSVGRVERLSTDDFLLQAGRPVDALHIILDGLFSVAVLEGSMNPLAVCFDCPVKTASTMTVVNTLTKGEIAGAIAFLDFRPLPVTIRAMRESLVLSIPRSVLTLKLQQDRGFASRFYRILGTQLAGMMQTVLEQMSGQTPTTTPQTPQLDEAMDDDELDLDSLQRMSNGANRFNWMLSQLGVGVS